MNAVVYVITNTLKLLLRKKNIDAYLLLLIIDC